MTLGVDWIVLAGVVIAAIWTPAVVDMVARRRRPRPRRAGPRRAA